MISQILNKIKLTDNYIIFIYTYLFLMPWNFFKWQMGVLTIILFIWWAIKFKKIILDKLKLIFQFKPLVILIIFVLYTYISSLWSDSFSEGFKHVNKFHKYYIVIIILLFTSLNKQEAKNGLNIILFSFGLYSLFSIIIYLGLFTIEETRSNINNPKGILAYAIVSTYMAIGALSSYFVMYFSDKKTTKILFLIVALLCLSALFVNNGRTAQVSLILGILTIILFHGRNYIFNFKYIISSILILISILLILTSLGKLDKYIPAYTQTQKIITENKYAGAFGVRVYFYKAGFEIVKDNFIFGMGPNDNINKLEQMQKNDIHYIDNTIYTSFHSQHLDLLTRYGFIGYFLLIFSVIYLLINLKYSKIYYFYGLSFFIITFYTSLANVMLTKKPFNYIFITIFVLLSIVAYYKENTIKEQDPINE